jgi:large subunit ribosomal protein L10
MKSKARKEEDLNVLTEQFKNSTSAMVLSFDKLTVAKDQEFRNELRETGAKYRVVKNTLARLAVEGTPFEEAREHFKGVTSVATIEGGEPVDLSKVISKYIKESKGVFEFKAGVVDGRLIDFNELEKIATLPSKEELIAKLLYLLNAPAQRLATVLSAIPRDLAVVLKQVSERTDNLPGEVAAEETKAEAPAEAETEAPTEEAATEEASTETEPAEETAEAPPAAEAPEEKSEAEEAGQKEEESAPAEEEKTEE